MHRSVEAKLGAGSIRVTCAVAVALCAAAGVSGCVLAPEGTAAEQTKLKAAGQPFEPPIEDRTLPPVPEPADWREVLRRGFMANGDLESAYFEWKAALARVDQAAIWPNSNVAVSYSYLFSSGEMKAWDRSTFGLGFDPSMNLLLPFKTRAAAKVSLEAAREAGERFRAAKFELQRRVLGAYLDLALTDEKIRIARDNLQLLKLLTGSAASRVGTGAPLQDLLKAQTDSQMAENELANLQAEAESMRSMLNGMLARDARAGLQLPASLPAPRPLAADDARLIAVAVDQNPELAGLARQVAGRQDAIELARLAYLPDLNPSASFTGGVSQTLGAMAMLPTTLPAIRAMVADNLAMSRASEAMLRQTRQDRGASFVANLYFMRNAERQAQLYRQRLVPAAQQLVNSSREAYASGMMGFADLIDSERMLIAVRLMAAEAQVEREKRLAELEALAGVDIETLGQPVVDAQAAPVAASQAAR
ncbi:MAG: TolC family protein [Nevskia sp.]|nr:TolC family protein [Nevskia sp.]